MVVRYKELGIKEWPVWPSPKYKIFRGAVVHSLSLGRLQLLPHALLGVRNDGSIAFLRSYDRFNMLNELDKALCEPGFYESTVYLIPSGHFLFPGMIDTHMHAPQWENLALGMDCSLREWIEQYTDPVEASFSDTQKAAEIYQDVVRTTLSLGSTTVAYNASTHAEATNILADICATSGQRAIVGKMCITTGSTSGNWEQSVDVSLRDSQACIDHIHDEYGRQNPLIQPSVTPRGGPYCPPELMSSLGKQVQDHDLHVQLHMCETESDIKRTLNMHPQKSYSAMYKVNGLFHRKTIVAHCIHLQQEDIDNLRGCQVGVAHCPNSNTCLRDGECKVRDLLDAGIKVGLGTDCSAGYMPSIHEAMRSASNVSRHLAMRTGNDSYVLSFSELVFLATLGGAQVLDMADMIGNFEPGKQLDALLIDATSVPSAQWTDLDEELLENMVKKWVFLGDARTIKKIWISGDLVLSKDDSSQQSHLKTPRQRQ